MFFIACQITEISNGLDVHTYEWQNYWKDEAALYRLLLKNDKLSDGDKNVSNESFKVL